MPSRMNWDQLRHKIDSGETGDKVRWMDPAIAPLGTDAEAGGASTAPEDIAASVPQEQPPDAAYAPSPGRAVVVLGVAGLLAIMLVLLLVCASRGA
jgi:hypothetical protein